MQQWQIDAVTDNLHELCLLTNCNSELIAIIQKQKLPPSKIHLGHHEKAELEATSNKYERSVLFFEMMKRKDYFYDPLISVLEEARQTGAAKILKDAKEYLEGLRENHSPVVFEPGTLNDLGFSELFKPQVLPPEQCTYYIPRTLCHRTELDPEVFKPSSTEHHIFLFKDVSKSDLARVTGYEIIESIETQLCRVTAKLILVNLDDDFDRICKITGNPVHMIRHFGKSYFWIKSSGGLESISKYLKEEGKSVDEEEMISRIISLQAPRAFIISDSPGMGKSLILAKLAKEVQKCCNNLCIFIVLQEFLTETNLVKVNSNSSGIEAIADYSSSSRVSKSLLLNKLYNLENQVYVFFDGYDEVVAEKLAVVDSFLKNLQGLTNVKLIMTTRPHLRGRLGSIFNELAYEIQPFNEENQAYFLTGYWTVIHQAVEAESLQKYAIKCLKALTKNLTDEEREIAGIPLQCMMLAEVYAEHAKRASTMRDPDDVEIEIEPTTLFQMYKRLVEFKMLRISKFLGTNSIPDVFVSLFRKTYAKYHVKLAINLLLPEWSKEFKYILTGDDDIDEGILYSIGLIEKVPNGQRFVHRTIAEYLLAEFIVKNLRKLPQCIHMLFAQILGRKGFTEIVKFVEISKLSHIGFTSNEKRYKELLKYPVIAYFLNMHLSEHPIEDIIASSIYSEDVTFYIEDLCTAAEVCCALEYEHTFDFVAAVLHSLEIGMDLKDRYFKFLPHIAVNCCKNYLMLEKVLNFTQAKFQIDLSYYTMEENEFRSLCGLPQYTPLHAAVWRGKYSFVTYLVNRYGPEQVRKLKHLLQASVFGSENDRSHVIQDKILIMDMLVGMNCGWINEKDGIDCTPLLQYGVHFDLLKRLLKHRADVNAHSKVHGTVLHTYADEKSYMDFVRMVLSKGFTLINHTDKLIRTPIMTALYWINDKDLDTFIDAGADLNGVDDGGNSVLFYALKCSVRVEVIAKLVQLGVDVNHTNKRKQNVAHAVMLNQRLDANQILHVLKLLQSKGFCKFQKKDRHGQTPLDMAGLAGRNEVLDTEVIRFLELNPSKASSEVKRWFKCVSI